jgi:hypothetical protein
MLAGLLVMIGFGAYHGLNPGMGWLFALALGLQQKSGRAIWLSLLPITLGHAFSIVIMAALVLAMGHLVAIEPLRVATAVLLLVFGVIKLLTYYRHPRWVGMRVGLRDLFVWSFLMALAHGAGLMVAPALLQILDSAHAQENIWPAATGLTLAVGLHTISMLAVMAGTAAIVYRWFGLKVLRQGWINFDLIWALALIVVGATALFFALA